MSFLSIFLLLFLFFLLFPLPLSCCLLFFLFLLRSQLYPAKVG